jgi:hypothetical protein
MQHTGLGITGSDRMFSGEQLVMPEWLCPLFNSYFSPLFSFYSVRRSFLLSSFYVSLSGSPSASSVILFLPFFPLVSVNHSQCEVLSSKSGTALRAATGTHNVEASCLCPAVFLLVSSWSTYIHIPLQSLQNPSEEQTRTYQMRITAVFKSFYFWVLGL